MDERLQLFSQTLALQVAEVIDAGLAVEPLGGTSAAWQQLCARHRVAPLDEETRYAVARSDGLYRGAPLAELRGCLDGIVRTLGEALGALGGIDAETRERLHSLLERLAPEALQQYRQIASEKPRGMFAHALATARKHQYSDLKGTSYVLRCEGCGGPRLRAFRCSFCGRDFGGG
jgi:hypothetical protein